MKAIALFLAAAAMLSAQNRLVEGNPTSSIRVIIYEDLQCPDCASFRVMLDQELLPRFRDKVAFEHRDFPLAKHPWARPAAIASRALESLSQAAALEFRKALMAEQTKITPANFNDYWMAFIGSHKIDPTWAKAALSDAGLAALVEQDYQEGVARGVARTPTVLVNGEPFIETFPAADIIKSVEREIAALKP